MNMNKNNYVAIDYYFIISIAELSLIRIFQLYL